MHKIAKAMARVSDYLIAFGPFGLFIVALFDSSFVPLPSSADAFMLILSTAHPRWMVFYAFIATAGSALGCLILYLVSRRAGTGALARFSEGIITLEPAPGKSVSFPLEQVEKANLKFEW